MRTAHFFTLHTHTYTHTHTVHLCTPLPDLTWLQALSQGFNPLTKTAAGEAELKAADVLNPARRAARALRDARQLG